MSSQILVVSPDDLSFDEYSAMQRLSFKDLFEEMGVSNDFITPDFFRWKYNSPYGQAKIILGKKNNEILAATMINPHRLKYEDETIIAWQNGDTATIPAARKIGLYPRCMKKAVSLVGGNEIIFGFPNKNSVRGFSFYVKHFKGLVPLWARPSFFRILPISGHIVSVSRFSTLKSNVFGLYSDRRPFFQRSSEYLDWRYSEHPIYDYIKYAYIDSMDQICGYIIARETIIQNHKAIIVMELVGKKNRVLQTLLSALSSRVPSLSVLLTFSTKLKMLSALQIGFIQVPQRIIPKKQVLYASAKGDSALRVLEQNWAIQMGDWDGF